MKSILFLCLLTLSVVVQPTYKITVDNQTNWSMRVEIWNEKGVFCPEPNHGDVLPAHTQDWWPTHNDCANKVRLHYPDGSHADIDASAGYKNFIVYQNDKGEFHWK